VRQLLASVVHNPDADTDRVGPCHPDGINAEDSGLAVFSFDYLIQVLIQNCASNSNSTTSTCMTSVLAVVVKQRSPATSQCRLCPSFKLTHTPMPDSSDPTPFIHLLRPYHSQRRVEDTPNRRRPTNCRFHR